MNKEYIESLIRKDIKAFGCDIWGTELIGSNTNPTLRIFIDKVNGITVSDCEKVSKHISKVIEADDSCSDNLSLEVSSPGIERRFFNKEQYLNYVGFAIKVRFKTEINQFKSTKGILLSVSNDGLLLNSDNEELFIKFDVIQKANLEFIGVNNAK